MLLASKVLLSSNIFPYKSSYSFKNSDHHKISFSDDGALKLGHFDIFDMLFPFLAFFGL